jgi:clan AA aspartic protease (TIGR02281 family)
MTRPWPCLRSCLALLLMLLGVPALLAQAPGRAAFQPRLAAVASVMDRFYRGESLDAGQKRVNGLAEAYNAQVQQRNGELDALRAQADRAQAPALQLAATLEAQDQALGRAPDPADRAAVAAYNERVQARNALVTQYNDRMAAARQAVDAANAQMQRIYAGLDQVRARFDGERQALKARLDAYAAFHDQGQDMVFFAGLNRLLADLRAACRSRPDPDLLAALASVRGMRRELAAWATAHEAAQDNGLVLVPAMVGDEPCCFIVDTGAQLVCLPEELVDALGLTGSLGEEATLTLAGGQKLRGRAITFPQVAVAGMAAAQVEGTAVPASEVGIDGLLGQSFLKKFVYTVDETRPGKLILVRR